MLWPGPENYRFCPLCGGRLENRLLKAGEPERLVCTACGFVFYIDPKLAVLALVPYKGGLVMARRAIEPGYGLWVAPGGFVDVGELVEDAVVRETLEEVNLRVRVIDNGFGIPEKYIDKIFERFFRVKDEKTRYITGTGLGLPIVKGLVDSLGGIIEVTSAVGEGSTFTVLLPLQPG